MAVAGQVVDEALPCIGLGPGEALERVLRAVGSDASYRTVQVAPDRVQFARTFRPTWAIVAGVATIWVALLGVLFFFVSSTETCVAAVESDHTGTRIRLHGRLTAATLGAIRAALRGDQPSGTPSPRPGVGVPVPSSVLDISSNPGAVAPELIIPSPPVATVAPLLAAPAPPTSSPTSVAASSTPPPFRPSQVPTPAAADDQGDHTIVVSRPVAASSIHLDDGRVVAVTGTVHLGRDPDGPGAVAVDDPGRSVSKTHVAVVAHGGGVGVTDLHSTNGVRLDQGDGSSVQLTAGVEVLVGDGAIVRFGDRSFVVTVPSAMGVR